MCIILLEIYLVRATQTQRWKRLCSFLVYIHGFMYCIYMYAYIYGYTYKEYIYIHGCMWHLDLSQYINTCIHVSAWNFKVLKEDIMFLRVMIDFFIMSMFNIHKGLNVKYGKGQFWKCFYDFAISIKCSYVPSKLWDPCVYT